MDNWFSSFSSWTQHMWEIIIAGASAMFSYVVYISKKRTEYKEEIQQTLIEHDTMLEVLKTRLDNLDEDIREIKDYLKRILFKL